MKTKIVLFIVFFLATKVSDAQIMFERTYGGTASDQGTGVQQTSDSGYIATGGTFSYGAGSNDVYLIKTDKYGDTLWTKTYGGNGWDIGVNVKQTMDGGYIITGMTSSFGAGSSDLYLIRTNSEGDTLWTKTFGGAEDDAGNSVLENIDSSFLVVGYSMSFSIAFSAAYIIKTDKNGNLLWQKSYEKSGTSGASDLHKRNNGGYIIVGSTDSSNMSHAMFYLIKLKDNGDTIWTKTYSIANGNIDAASIDITVNNGYAFSGSITYPNGEADLCLMKTDTNGNFLWLKKIGGIGAQMGGKFCQTNDGGFVLTGVSGDPAKGINFSDNINNPLLFNNIKNGWTNGDLYLLRTNNNGDSLWSRTYGGTGNDFGCSIQQTYDNGFIICGGMTTGTNQDLHLIKTDNTGVTGFEDYYLKETDFNLFPNPSNGILQIQSSVSYIENGTVNVLDYAGQVITSKTINLNEKNQIDLRKYGSGIYIIQFIGNSDNFIKKVIILQ